MRRWSRYVVGVLAVASLGLLVGHAAAETCTLEMKTIGESPPISRSEIPIEYLFQSTYPQSFFRQIGGPQGMVVQQGEKEKPDFSKVIKKEPAEYASENPFRGVASLGTGHYGFVLDEAPKEKKEPEAAEADEKEEEKKEDASEGEGGLLSTLAKALGSQLPSNKKKAEVPQFTRLYFDLNHNGDLTDDEVIEASQSRAGSMYQASFPLVKLKVDVNGKEIDYAFRFSLYSYSSGQYGYTQAQLNASAYRTGEIELDGKKHRVALVDFNSNGRFDDQGGVNTEINVSSGVVYPRMGDMLFIDPKASRNFMNPYDSTSNDAQYQVAKLICLGGRYYDLKIDPSGETLSLEPSLVGLGYVSNPNKGFRAVLYGDQGLLEIADDGSGKAGIPEGEWKLMSYTIDMTNEPKDKTDEKKDEEGKEESGSVLDLLSEVLSPQESETSRVSRPSVVSARATRDYKAVKVTAEETVKMPFGPPFQPRVEASNFRKGIAVVPLELSLVGTAGETCSSLLVNGRQPSAPKFTISTKDGEEVTSGAFRYG